MWTCLSSIFKFNIVLWRPFIFISQGALWLWATPAESGQAGCTKGTGPGSDQEPAPRAWLREALDAVLLLVCFSSLLYVI